MASCRQKGGADRRIGENGIERSRGGVDQILAPPKQLSARHACDLCGSLKYTQDVLDGIAQPNRALLKPQLPIAVLDTRLVNVPPTSTANLIDQLLISRVACTSEWLELL